uniref:Spectrin beta-like polypeptide n=1 Tax=Rattus norvegicus TaxID=10116 RepID=Q5I4G1_RAT|nr:spectrin beta-like polypeptide [Rattus norvegicus]
MEELSCCCVRRMGACRSVLAMQQCLLRLGRSSR